MPACSELSRDLGEPLAGTAPHVRVWVAVEQPGPWGRRALLDSRLDRALGAELTRRTAQLPVRVVLVRRPGHHPDPGGAVERTVLVARVSGTPALWRTTTTDPGALLDLDLTALAGGADPGLPAGRPDVLLVCTNGRRDACCARRGRAAAAELAAAGHEVWESSHLGGHRFSPTVLSLPSGWLFGGPRATTLGTAAARGRTALPPEEQAAELAALAARAEVHPRALDVVAVGSGRYRVDGRPVAVERQPRAERPESCGAAAVPASSLAAHLTG